MEGPSSITAIKRKHYPYLDGLRALAVLWVIALHANYFFYLKGNWGGVFIYLDHFFRVGHLGVDLFFVISGFLITGVLLEETGDTITVRRFYIRRFFKIIPQYYFILLIGLFFSYGVDQFSSGPISNYEKKANVLYHFLLIQNYSYLIPTLGHTWSLAVEEHFYLFYPWLLMLIYSPIIPKRLRGRALMSVLIGLIVMTNVLRYIVTNHSHSFLTGGPNTILTTFFRVDALLFGCLLKILEMDDSRRLFVGRKAKLFVLAAGLIYGYFILKGFDGNCWYHYTLAYLAAGGLLVGWYSQAPIFINNGFLRWIGRNSYGIYLWHYIMLFPFLAMTYAFDLKLIVMGYVLSSLAMGVLSTRIIEKYFLDLRKKVCP